jgi:mitochondrial fission protein ELM1
MAEIINLFMDMAGKDMPQLPQAAGAQFAQPLYDLHINLWSARMRFDIDRDVHASSARREKRLGKPAVAEVICNPMDFSARGYSFDAILQQFGKCSRGPVRSTKLNMHRQLVFPGESSKKRVWVLLTSKKGDNAQSLNLAAALDLPFRTVELFFATQFEKRKPRVEASVHHLDSQKSDALIPPWPDLIIVTGRRPSMAALWVKRESGGRTKIALIGKPKAQFDEFDLVIAPAHYRVPEERPNVCRIGLPPISIAPDRLETARHAWSAKLAVFRRPITALCFGGSTGARALNPAAVRQIMASARVAASDGTLYVLTSRRTPSDAHAVIAKELPETGLLYPWKDNDPDNPYLGLLAEADRFIVTGDSISMLVEIARLGKPLAIAALPPEGGLYGFGRRLISKLTPRQSRDFELLHSHLYQNGWAVPLGKEFIEPICPPPDDTDVAVARLRRLLPCG